MSPKFALSLLLLCFVLLGLCDAQRRQQQQQQQFQQQPRSNYRVQGKYRNMGGDGSFGTDTNPPPLDAPGDCNQNNLASNNQDRFHRKQG